MNKEPEKQPETDREVPLEVARIGELVRRLCVTKANLGLYSFEHSVTQDNLRKAWEYLGEILSDRQEVSLDIFKNTILFEGLPIEERNPMVERLARDFRNLRVRGISFRRGLALKEIAIFFKMMTLPREKLEEHGGAGALLRELGVELIRINQARYVRIEDDQKVVNVALQASGEAGTETEAKQELLGQLWEALMKQQVDRDWLLEEIRTDPARAASQIVGLMKYYDNIETMEDQQRQQEAMETLLRSVQTLGLRLAERDREEAGDQAEDLAGCLLQLERELKTRSAGLKTSRAASRFIQEITNAVTAFIDTHQADRIAREFLKDEKGLKRTEQLLRQAVDGDRESTVVEKLRALAREKGIGEEELECLLDGVKPKRPPVPKRPRRKKASRPVREKIARALASSREGGLEEETADRLAGIFEYEVKERLRGERFQREHLESVIARLDLALSAAGLGLVLLDPGGEVVLATVPVRERFGDLAGTRLDPAFLALLKSGAHGKEIAPVAGLPPGLPGSVQGVLLGEDGELLGFTVSSSAGSPPA